VRQKVGKGEEDSVERDKIDGYWKSQPKRQGQSSMKKMGKRISFNK